MLCFQGISCVNYQLIDGRLITLSVCMGVPVARSQSRTVVSPEPLAK